MKGFDEFQKQQAEFEDDANTKHESTGAFIHWAFLWLGAAISAGASFYIGHRGMSGNPFYERTIGASNAAWLIVAALDGTFLALCYGMATFLKSSAQRQLAGCALTLTKAVLCLNILCAFLLVQGVAVAGVVRAYVVYGAPLVIGGIIWLWSSLYSLRRQNIRMASALDAVAKRDDLWRTQYLAEQARDKAAYDVAMQSPQMQALRNEAARQKAIADLASNFGLTLAVAEKIHAEAEDERARRPAEFPPAPVRHIGEWGLDADARRGKTPGKSSGVL